MPSKDKYAGSPPERICCPNSVRLVPSLSQLFSQMNIPTYLFLSEIVLYLQGLFHSHPIMTPFVSCLVTVDNFFHSFNSSIVACRLFHGSIYNLLSAFHLVVTSFTSAVSISLVESITTTTTTTITPTTMHSGPDQPRNPMSVLGHSLVRSLVRSHRSLVGK